MKKIFSFIVLVSLLLVYLSLFVSPAIAETLYDDFEPGTTIDTTLWSVYDTGTNIIQSNGVLSTGGNGSWDENGMISSGTITRTVGKVLRYTIDAQESQQFWMGGLQSINTELDFNHADSFALYLFNTALYIQHGATNENTGYTISTSTEYTVEVGFKSGGGFLVFIDGGAFSNQLIYNNGSQTASPYYFAVNDSYNYSENMHLDDVYLDADATVSADWGPYRLIPNGDSIVLGGAGEVYGWRDDLQDELGVAPAVGGDYNFVGPNANPASADLTYANRHNGTGSQPTAILDSNIASHLDTYMPTPNLPGAWAVFHTATADFALGSTYSQVFPHLESAVTKVYSHDPTINIMVARIIPSQDEDSNIPSLNALIDVMVPSMNSAGWPVYSADVWQAVYDYGVSWSTDLYTDNWHPNDLGYSVMGSAFFDAMTDAVGVVDTFNDNSIDGKWIKIETAEDNTIETNSRMEFTGNSNWDVNGIVSRYYVTRNATSGVSWDFNKTTGGFSIMLLQPIGHSLDFNATGTFGIFLNNQNIYIQHGATNEDSGEDISTATEYTFAIEFSAAGFKVNIDGGAFEDQEIYSGGTQSDTEYYYAVNAYSGGLYVDNVSECSGGCSLTPVVVPGLSGIFPIGAIHSTIFGGQIVR